MVFESRGGNFPKELMALGIRGRAYLCEQSSIKRYSITIFSPFHLVEL